MEMPDVVYVQKDLIFVEVTENDDFGCSNGDAYHHSRVVESLRRENEEMKARIKLFEITGKDDPSIVECCFSGEYKMDDKQTIEHLYKWFKDFFLLVGRYVKDDKND